VEEQTQDNGTAGTTRLQKVLCPVRGGKRSSKTVERAIELAKERDCKLIFLYVVDVDFLGYATVARVKLMVDELVETGSFALEILSEKATDAGVKEVEPVILEGSITETIRDTVRERGATVLVTGKPGQTPAVKSFTESEFESFLRSLKEQFDLEIERVE